MRKPLAMQPVDPPTPGPALHLSGILVRSDSGGLEAVAAALSRTPGVEVHHLDPATGKLVVTLEAASRRAAEDGLRAIQALPGVLLAEPVYHYVDREDGCGPSRPQGPGGCP